MNISEADLKQGFCINAAGTVFSVLLALVGLRYGSLSVYVFGCLGVALGAASMAAGIWLIKWKRSDD